MVLFNFIQPLIVFLFIFLPLQPYAALPLIFYLR